jgi:hypothetical protein
MNSTGKGRGLARDMLGKEYAVRDLAIRVNYSKLKGKDELGKSWIPLLILPRRLRSM